MTKLDKMTIEELEQEIEMWLDGIEDTLSHRCYPEHSRTGVWAIQLQVRQHLAWIDRALLEIETRVKKEKTDEKVCNMRRTKEG